jgi:hypothetical protein
MNKHSSTRFWPGRTLGALGVIAVCAVAPGWSAVAAAPSAAIDRPVSANGQAGASCECLIVAQENSQLPTQGMDTQGMSREGIDDTYDHSDMDTQGLDTQGMSREGIDDTYDHSDMDTGGMDTSGMDKSGLVSGQSDGSSSDTQ